MVRAPTSRGLPYWVVVAGGVVLGLALVVAYLLANLPPQAAEIARASYERGYEAGARSERPAVRRTPVTAGGLSPGPGGPVWTS